VRVDRSAADDRGVEPDADQHLATAGGSSGTGLPGELRGRLEGSLGVPLDGVRVHTGDASASAASSIHARAYAVGQDIHFGAHQYAPGTPSGDYLIAHEVAHTVQQRGGAGSIAMDSLDVSSPGDAHEIEADAFADAFSRGERAPVTGSGAGGLARQIMRTPEDDLLAAAAALPRTMTSTDVAEVDWGATPSRLCPDRPANPWTPTIAAEPPSAPRTPMTAPPEPDWSSTRCGPEPADPFRMPAFDAAAEDMNRRAVWTAYRTDATTLSSSWNSVARLDNEFMLTESANEDALRTVHNFRIERGIGDADAAANAQPAGRSGGDNPLTVGDLFHSDTIGDRRVSTGTDLEISRSADTGIDHAAGHVNDELEAVRSADSDLAAACWNMRAETSEVRARESGVREALAHIDTTAADRSLGAASSAVSDVTARIASVQRTVGDVLNLLQGFAGLLEFGSAPAAAGAGSFHSDMGHAGSVAGSSAIESIANRIVDAVYAEELETARRAVTVASEHLVEAIDTENRERVNTATGLLTAAIDRVRARRSEVQARLSDRRVAYEALATAAATRSGAAAGSRDYNQIRGAIAAIPVVETMVAKSVSARDAAVVPAYTGESGQGLGLAQHHGHPEAQEFIDHVGYTRAYRNIYESYTEFWTERRDSLRLVVDRLEDNH
jgi:hypothetical protein